MDCFPSKYLKPYLVVIIPYSCHHSKIINFRSMNVGIVPQVFIAAVYGNETYFQLSNAQLTLYSIYHGIGSNDSSMKLRIFELQDEGLNIFIFSMYLYNNCVPQYLVSFLSNNIIAYRYILQCIYITILSDRIGI